MKKTILSLLILTLFCTANFAQPLIENFNDGSFTDGPVWGGDTGIFVINTDGELQLMDNIENTAYLSVNAHGETVWEFYVRMEFNPSSGNYTRVYLNSNSVDLSDDLNGYFVEIGRTNDAVELRRQDGGSSDELIVGEADKLDTSPAIVRVQVTRDASGNWELLTDYSGGTAFTSEGTAFDNTYSDGEFFGFFCDYTVSRANKFFFDDVHIDTIIVIPPEIQEIVPVSTTALDVRFSEPVALPSAEITSNYTVSGVGSPANVQLDAADATLVHLTGFNPPFSNNQTYTLTVTGVQDLMGNPADDSETFTFLLLEAPEPFDILINEFMAAEDDNFNDFRGAEYVELYNRSDKFIDLSSLEFNDGAASNSPLSGFMESGSFVILTDEGNLFNPNLTLIDVSISLSNNGDVILLIDSDGQIIDQKSYDSGEVEKAFSTELVNPDDFCTLDTDNWQITQNPLGGTPGMENSVYNPLPDVMPPTPICAKIEASNNAIFLIFDEFIDVNSAQISANYMVNNGIGEPSDFTLNEEGNTITLNFDNTFEEGVFYEITINNIADCTLENAMENASTLSFARPESVAPFDILINEFMAESVSDLGGIQSVEYIELYNRSDKYFLLEQLRLSDDGGSGFRTLPECAPLPPGEYVILTDPGNESLFAGGNVYGYSIGLSNEGDEIWLQNLNGQTIHRKPFGPDEVAKGISTELINPESYCSSSNWAISTDPLGGTPGRDNSQYNPSADQAGPELICVNVEGENTLRLVFSEILNRESATDELNYVIDNIGNPTSAFMTNIDDEVLLNFSASFEEDIIHQISVTGVSDCTENNIIGTENTGQFSYSEALAGDLVINEILYEAPTGGVDFVEMYNNSDKILPINGLQILEQQNDSFYTANIEVRCPLHINEYMAFSTDPRDTRTNYPLTPNPGGIHYANLPAFDDGSILSILGMEQLFGRDTIDRLIVDENYHNPLADITKGVSLERIDFNAPTQDPNNWQSAAENVGWATPAYENSQYRPSGTGSGTGDCVTIDDEVFSPDNDGFEDFLRIDYNLDAPGYIANVRIFDARGRQVKELVNNQLLEPEGFFRWDGDTDEGQKARLGIYIVWVELFDATGNVTRCKNTCVVAGQF